ncbi:uncharacterized protein LOC121987508 [Zingiber officinale]|uniref:Uncharacterized protein n=1 Tax=Zingiber officinale TaxID=94328 RepID=A0A8J5GHT4_ZINOF|nr:uncharacterized protein LOC121987508 [Zingiber officinale]KAG6503587.1 hypothetical protein ZIOFF_035903 [Zingiber officinale]
MRIRLLDVVASLVLRAARRLSGCPRDVVSRSGRRRRRREKREWWNWSYSDDAAGAEEDGGVWRRTILMGEKCKPLDFPGVIYYDADGRRLSEVPTPRSPMRSPFLSYTARSPVTAGYST